MSFKRNFIMRLSSVTNFLRVSVHYLGEAVRFVDSKVDELSLALYDEELLASLKGMEPTQEIESVDPIEGKVKSVIDLNTRNTMDLLSFVKSRQDKNQEIINLYGGNMWRDGCKGQVCVNDVEQFVKNNDCLARVILEKRDGEPTIDPIMNEN